MASFRNPSSSIDSDFTLVELFGDCISKHRSCWLHVAANHYNREKKITFTEVKDIKKRFRHASPCYLRSFPHCKRSIQTRIPRIRKKLDTVTFELYMEVVWKRFSEERRMSFVHLDSLWFSCYRKPASKPKVLNWIKEKRIFSKDYVFVPVVCWNHWSLLILVHFGHSLDSETRTPCMLLLDSLEKADPRRLEPQIRKFVLDIFTLEGRNEDRKVISKIPLLIPKVPQQNDDKECGSFVLYFINSFMENAPENFSKSEGYPYFMDRNWFDHDKLEYFRDRLEKELSSNILAKKQLSKTKPTTNKSAPIGQKFLKRDGVILLDD